MKISSYTVSYAQRWTNSTTKTKRFEKCSESEMKGIVGGLKACMVKGERLTVTDRDGEVVMRFVK